MGRRTGPVERLKAGDSDGSALAAPGHFGPARAVARAALGAVALWSLPAAAAPATQAADQQQRMVVEAQELVQDDNKNTVTATGNVQIYYKGRILEADKVVYDRNTDRVLAVGHARLTESNGQVSYAEKFELTDDLKQGFVDSLRVETPQETYMSSPRAERTDDTTVLDYGTYTACKPCEDQSVPPLWRVRAKRVIHDEDEKTLYFQDAGIEFFGQPIAWLPFFSTPDPTVKRRSGILAPKYYPYNSRLGLGTGVPIYWAITPSIDLMFTPNFFVKQGFLGDLEFQQRLDSGVYSFRLQGIRQFNPGAFVPEPLGSGDMAFRWAGHTKGAFDINDNWKWGWDITALSDRYFFYDYALTNPLAANLFFRESSSTAYLTGKGERSWFDLRGFYFQGLSPRDYQPQLSAALPMFEYNRSWPLSPTKWFGVGGDFEIDANANVSHAQAALYESIQPRTFDSLYGLYNVCQNYAPSANPNLSQCLLRGVGGDFARGTVQASWKRAYIDQLGEVWTPFAFARLSGAYLNYDTGRVYGIYNQSMMPLFNASQTLFYGTDNIFRGQFTPGVGLEYRYPLLARLNFGTVTFEPIVQLVARPNLIGSNSLVNIDSQSLVFDDSNLFNWSKYSGYDRFETGTRLNYGGQFTLNFNNGGFINAMAGQSYLLAGTNGYATPDAANVGLASGLDTRRSDYVGRIAFAPNGILSFVAKGRFDQADFHLRRLDLVASATVGPLTATAQYANYSQQSVIGFDKRRQGLSFGARYDITKNYFVNGNVQFDMSRYLYNSPTGINGVYGYAPLFSVAGMGLGGGYHDECTTFSVNYTSVYQVNTSTGLPGRNQTILMTLQLRTLGETKVGASLGFLTVNDGVKQSQ
jgi:LPS-assembly protein